MKHFLWVSFFFLLTVSAQEIPPIERYNIDEFGAGNQNWMISQSENKFIYIANNEGLLEFNGTKWNLYPSPNNTILRSVKVVKDLIYTGCFMEFGYWKNDGTGNLNYFSLKESLNEDMIEDEQIWSIINMDKWVLFQSFKRIYIYDTVTKEFNIIDSENQIKKIFKIKNSIYYIESNQGLFQINEGVPSSIINNEFLNKNEIIALFEVSNDLLFLTRDNGFYFYKDGEIVKWDIKGDEILGKSTIFSSIRLNNGSFIIGTISNGIVNLSATGEVEYQINHDNGLSNNTILSLFEDVDENLWLGLDNGVNTINLKSPITIYKDYKGILGIVYCSKIYKGNLYLGTNQGLFYKKTHSSEAPKMYKGTNGQVWSLNVIDDKLFCGHHLGTFIIDDKSTDLLASQFGTWNVQKVPNKTNLLIQGTYDGFYVLEKKANKWEVRNKIDGFDISSRFFESLSDTELIVNHEYKGLYKLLIDKDYSKVLNSHLDTTLTKGKNSSIITYKNKVIYANKNGIFTYINKENLFKKDTILSELISDKSYTSGKLVLDESENLWMFSKKNIYHITPNQLINTPRVNSIPVSNKLRKGKIGFENVSQLSESEYLIGVSNGFLRLNLLKIRDKNYSVNLNTVSYNNENNQRVYLNLEDNNELENNQNDLKFNFSVAEYNKFLLTEYQYKLEGLDSKWSNFSTTSDVIYKNLKYTDYTFKLRARVGNTITPTKVFSFSVGKPWYLTNTFLLIYAFMLIIMIMIIHKTYKWYYKRQYNHNLLKKEQLIMSIKNEKLNQDIENKSRELATSTMSLVRKNKVLSSIKRELMDGDNNLAIKLIDKNLNNEKDWKFFERAFNNADKNFFNNIKNAHPNLTPNNLRFCAYLRLNLTSKELAPLLNISYRSVEIKRYRLRKKMNIDKSMSLTSHILKF